MEEIRTLIKNTFPKEKITSIQPYLSGSSYDHQPSTFKVSTTSRTVVVKKGNCQEEIDCYQKLYPHLGEYLPQIIYADKDFIIREHREGLNIREILALSPDRHKPLPEILLRILRVIGAMWMSTNIERPSPRFPRFQRKIPLYWKRISPLFPSDKKVVVNGLNTKLSIQDCFLIMQEYYQKPLRPSCLCFGDLNPNNVIISDSQFSLIDPKPECFDFVEDLVRLGRIKNYLTAKILEAPRILEGKNFLEIFYQITYQPIAEIFERICFNFGKELTKNVEDETEYIEREDFERCFKLIWAMALLREVEYPQRERQFEVPKGASIFTLGEALLSFQNSLSFG